MKKTIYILALLALLLAAWLVVLWLPSSTSSTGNSQETRYGVNEGVELVEQDLGKDGKRYIVEDANGKELFVIPLRNCLLDTRFRNGQLRFREQGSLREGYIDRQGIVTFTSDAKVNIPENTHSGTILNPREKAASPVASSLESQEAPASSVQSKGKSLPQVDLRAMAQDNPFYKEASKIMQGKLTETDANRRHMILNYCEHFRTAYTTKDIDFLRQVFSDKALIIVGNVVKSMVNDSKCQAEPKVSYAIHSKQDYLNRLSKVFAANKKLDVKFSGFRIMRHPTMDGIYGVTLRQQYKSDRYSDDGYLFLLWDFRDKSMPLIHVRTWQPATSVTGNGDVISIQDFNLE